MLGSSPERRMIYVGAAIGLCTTVAAVALAAPTLQSVAVTPAARSLSVGGTQRYTATGTFSDGSTQALEAAGDNVALGFQTTCVLLTTGGVDCWGKNDKGQLGDGNTVDSLIPRPVKWITNAKAVASEWEHGCAVVGQGAVRCWGNNNFGQLGNGTTTNSALPVRVIGISSATAVAVGWGHSCALLASGAIRCWGVNTRGELGHGTDASWSSAPVNVVGIHSATALAVGWKHSCALLANGAVQCWGHAQSGQLGDGTTTTFSGVPVAVRGINNATGVATGAYFSCALLATGAVQCWGYGDSGELGSGTFADSSVPVPVTGISAAVALTAGGFHACAVLGSGSTQCWGSNSYGELGAGSLTTSSSNIPVPVSEISAPVKVVAGLFHTCALLSDGAMRCWGYNSDGQLGDRRKTGETRNPRPVNVIGTPGVVWESSDPTKAAISMRGRATASAPGNTTITATTAGFVNDNAVLTVK